MPGIDAHQHFWKYQPARDSWITDEMAAIRKDFLPRDLQPLLEQNNLDGCVVVQSSQSEEENIFQLLNAEEHNFIKGIVGWINLQGDDVEERLAFYRSFKKMKGFRHVLQGETRRDLVLSPEFMNGISQLNRYGFTYDLLMLPDQLPYVHTLVASFPGQKFVIDHIAKPVIKEKRIDAWKKDMELIAGHENVYCKISGMVTEANWYNWKPEDFTAYLDIVVNAFGRKRIMFGSDWPVCLLAGDYEKVIGIVKEYFSVYSREEQELFFGENAIRFYDLT